MPANTELINGRKHGYLPVQDKRQSDLYTSALVIEGESGYYPSKYLGDKSECQEVCERINASLGISEMDVHILAIRSMRR